jgi:uncharacterized protein YeeX (DUF496 family)
MGLSLSILNKTLNTLQDSIYYIDSRIPNGFVKVFHRESALKGQGQKLDRTKNFEVPMEQAFPAEQSLKYSKIYGMYRESKFTPAKQWTERVYSAFPLAPGVSKPNRPMWCLHASKIATKRKKTIVNGKTKFIEEKTVEEYGHCMVFDFDDITIEYFMKRADLSKIFAVSESASGKAHAFVRLTGKPASDEEFKELYSHIGKELFNDMKYDPACNDPKRFFFFDNEVIHIDELAKYDSDKFLDDFRDEKYARKEALMFWSIEDPDCNSNLNPFTASEIKSYLNSKKGTGTALPTCSATALSTCTSSNSQSRPLLNKNGTSFGTELSAELHKNGTALSQLGTTLIKNGTSLDVENGTGLKTDKWTFGNNFGLILPLMIEGNRYRTARFYLSSAKRRGATKSELLAMGLRCVRPGFTYDEVKKIVFSIEKGYDPSKVKNHSSTGANAEFCKSMRDEKKKTCELRYFQYYFARRFQSLEHKEAIAQCIESGTKTSRTTSFRWQKRYNEEVKTAKAA